MNEIIKNINLNVRQPNNFQLITAMQNDNETIKIIATLYNGNSLYTIEKSIDIIRLTGRTANDAIIDCIITDYTNHTVTFVLTKNMLSSDGDMKLSISMTDSSTNQILSTYPFTIKVHNSPVGSFSVTEIKTLDEYVQKAKDYADEAKNYATSWTGSLLPQGDITFAQLPTSGMIKGYLYCITNFFNTDSRFEEGVGYFYPAGTCVYWTENNQWKCLSGVLSRQISQADYDNLSEAEKNNGTIYYIDDGDNEIKLASSIINGLMSNKDKNKLDGIEDGANKTIVDSALSSTSTNPVQNKVINDKLEDKVDKVNGKGLSTNDLTTVLKTNYDSAYSHSTSTHARTDATKVEKSATNGNIKINGTETTVYTHPNGTNPHGTTKSDIGLGNVGNFKAVSTVASQGLSDVEKSNARENIGAQPAGSYAYASHTHGNGDITSLDASKITSGTISIDRLPQGALERLSIVADDTARFKLTSATVQKGDTVKVTSTGKMYYVVDETKLSTEAGYEVYAAGTAASVPWSGVTGKPSTYTPSSHTHTKSQITDFPTSMTANGGNSDTVNNHTVKSDVPENAKFTDTTYDIVSTEKDGLMSVDDKKKLDSIKYVEITQSEYDKLATIESNVIYFITD